MRSAPRRRPPAPSTTIPYDEAALRALMRAHVGAGRPASALSVYADVRARLAADLGVSPDARTEALHAEVLGLEEAPSVPDRFDPLVQRARVELATNDLSAARRDADEAVRRGGGPAAMEMAGWVAYYCRDFPAALRWAEDAVAGAADPERRASASALAGRIRHSFGDLAEAERRLATARESSVAGVREMGEVWLGSLRAHQGRPAEALDHAERGATDAAALRHPFAISHALLAQVYALGMQGRVADVLARLDVWDRTLDDLGPLGARYRPAGLNFRAWVTGAIGRDTEARALSEAAIEHAEGLTEARTHAVLDLARLAVDADDGQEATRVLDGLEVAEDRTGTMAWHQRQRLGTIRAQIHLLAGEPLVAEELASAVARDAAARGAAARRGAGRRRRARGERPRRGELGVRRRRRAARPPEPRGRLGAVAHRGPVGRVVGRRGDLGPRRAVGTGPRRGQRRGRRGRGGVGRRRASAPACGDEARSTIMRRTSGGAPSSRAVAVATSRSRAPVVSRATKGAMGASARRHATRSSGPRSGNATPTCSTVASGSPAARATAAAASTSWSRGIVRARTSVAQSGRRQPTSVAVASTTCLGRMAVVVGVGRRHDRPAGPHDARRLHQSPLRVVEVVEAEGGDPRRPPPDRAAGAPVRRPPPADDPVPRASIPTAMSVATGLPPARRTAREAAPVPAPTSTTRRPRQSVGVPPTTTLASLS